MNYQNEKTNKMLAEAINLFERICNIYACIACPFFKNGSKTGCMLDDIWDGTYLQLRESLEGLKDEKRTYYILRG